MKIEFGRLFATCTLITLLMLNGFILVWSWSRHPVSTGAVMFINTLVAAVIAVNNEGYRYFLARAKGLLWSTGKILLFIIYTITIFSLLFSATRYQNPTTVLFIGIIWIATLICFTNPLSIMGIRVKQTELSTLPRQRVINGYHVAGTLGTVGILYGAIFAGGYEGFINVPAIMFTYGITFFILLALYKQTFMAFIPDSLMSLISQPVTTHACYSDIAASGARVCIGAGTIGTLIGFVQMMRALDDPSAVGVGLATLTLTLFYGIVGAELYFFFLYKIYAAKTKQPTEKQTLPLSNLAIPFMVIMFIFVLTLLFILATT